MKRLMLVGWILVSGLALASDWTMFDRRLGMFIHWGIYSVNGWHEQEEMRRKVPRAEYEKAAAKFTAEKFDANAFVSAAESMGAEYIVFTAKHHDGLWKSGVSLRPMKTLPESATLLNTGASVTCEVVSLPSDWRKDGAPALHLSGLPADEMANQSVVIRIER